MRTNIPGILLFILVAAGCAYSQQSSDRSHDPAQPADTTKSAQPAGKPIYVFPDNRERFRRYLKSTIGPVRLGWSAASAGISQWGNTPEEWGQGAQGFGKRYASSLGSNAIQQTVTYALDETLNLDTGFQKSTRSGFFPRLKDALVQNVTSRTQTGKRVILAPKFAGVYSGAIISRTTWYPERYSYKDGLRSGTHSLLEGFGLNLIREFVFNW
ncbi:MAG TPA: hypothetical protein VJ749_10645 [Pyrinomonadaceae bacterium]|nr:hypothetical protein [Pyrinomonadaceae bacterium]